MLALLTICYWSPKVHEFCQEAHGNSVAVRAEGGGGLGNQRWAGPELRTRSEASP